jgi:hypothetical protein
MARWTIQVDDKTDRAVRTLIARQGGKEGDLSDLSRFVEQAAKQQVFWLTVDAARSFNQQATADEIDAAVDAALDEVRAERP